MEYKSPKELRPWFCQVNVMRSESSVLTVLLYSAIVCFKHTAGHTEAIKCGQTLTNSSEGNYTQDANLHLVLFQRKSSMNRILPTNCVYTQLAPWVMWTLTARCSAAKWRPWGYGTKYFCYYYPAQPFGKLKKTLWPTFNDKLETNSRPE